MKIEQWPIERPIPYARNARKISQAAITKVAASIKEFGWQQPIVVDAEGVIVVGHTRLLAAQKLELAKVPVHVAKDLTSAQVKAYRIMDNRSHDEAKWDLDLLVPELAELKELAVDLSLTGFDFAEIEKMTDGPPEPEPGADQSGELVEQFQVLVTCPDEQAQAALLEQLTNEGHQCRALIS